MRPSRVSMRPARRARTGRSATQCYLKANAKADRRRQRSIAAKTESCSLPNDGNAASGRQSAVLVAGQPRRRAIWQVGKPTVPQMARKDEVGSMDEGAASPQMPTVSKAPSRRLVHSPIADIVSAASEATLSQYPDTMLGLSWWRGVSASLLLMHSTQIGCPE